ncbi:hypothetical protein [Lactococcus allomyrinae]|uniref:hypothetical protein n=1 Tax=Lactococcus allomyrinae TaxID=2419773 RepID=UPI0013C42C05|nr:hypothetical protein [Lactococcus allomyrinae]
MVIAKLVYYFSINIKIEVGILGAVAGMLGSGGLWYLIKKFIPTSFDDFITGESNKDKR